MRGVGSMMAVEFVNPQTGEPSPELTKRVQERALAEGILLLSCGVYGNVIRFLYPLTIPEKQFQQALEVIRRALTE